MLKGKRIFALLAAVLVLFIAGCSPVPPLPDGFDEDTVMQAAKDTIALLNAQDSAGLRAVSSDTLTAALTDETLSAVYTDISAGGAFLEYGEAAAFGADDKTTDTQYAVVVMQAKYESKTFTYTLSFDTDMKLVGLYYK
ncbi:MAG: DUF3887 domain-containing protein [Clostridiaceae bacterium]|nr:DUF3887 domain-containing protein [Eubacteriales bacterium]